MTNIYFDFLQSFPFLVFCKGGYEIYPSGTENCRECLRGFYKEEANLTGSCAPCHADYVTPTNASISEDNCTVGKLIHPRLR